MRIRLERDFEAGYAEGQRLRGPTLTVIAKSNGLENARLGISVGKKKMKRAVDRNRFKRLVREAFRLNPSKIPQGFDYIVIPNRGDSPFSLQSISAELTELASRARKRSS